MFKLNVKEIESIKKAWGSEETEAAVATLQVIKGYLVQGKVAVAIQAIDDMILATQDPSAYLKQMEKEKQNV